MKKRFSLRHLQKEGRAVKPQDSPPQAPPIFASTFHFEPRNDAQRLACELFSKKKLLFLVGAAGTGKTHAAVALALEYTLAACAANKKKRDFEPIVLTRPIVEAAGEQLGFIPGTVDEKIAPYLEPAYAVVDRLKRQILSPVSGDDFNLRKLFKAVPLAYMRGTTFYNAAILEEAQNCNLAQLTCFLTRMGKGCKMIITADPSQHDGQFTYQGKKKLGRPAILDVIRKLQDLEEVGVVRMTEQDTLRDPFITKVIRRLGVYAE